MSYNDDTQYSDAPPPPNEYNSAPPVTYETPYTSPPVGGYNPNPGVVEVDHLPRKEPTEAFWQQPRCLSLSFSFLFYVAGAVAVAMVPGVPAPDYGSNDYVDDFSDAGGVKKSLFLFLFSFFLGIE
jgi:hypothetical protein